MEEGIVFPLGNAYKLIDLDGQGLVDAVTVEYKFAHDRIQQAAYALIPEAEKHCVQDRQFISDLWEYAAFQSGIRGLRAYFMWRRWSD